MYYDNTKMLSESKITQSFTRALSSYNQEAVVQKGCADKLNSYINDCLLKSEASINLNSVFEFGCGTGFLSQQLVESLTIKHLTLNDLIAEYVQHLTRTLKTKDFDFICGDIDKIPLESKFDLICSSSCAQWSIDLPNLLLKLSSALTRNGHLAISSFSTGHFNELNFLNSHHCDIAHTANEPLTYWSTDEWHKQLNSTYHIKVLQTETITKWFNSVRDVLLHLRLTGVNGSAGRAWSQKKLLEFECNYQREFSVNGKFPLTYCPIYIVAQKKF